MYPDYRLGNIVATGLSQLANSPKQQAFGKAKSADLPDYCRRCEVRFACQGECPKNRFMRTPDGQPGLNYLCPSYTGGGCIERGGHSMVTTMQSTCQGDVMPSTTH
jgi:uncharacterized protein